MNQRRVKASLMAGQVLAIDIIFVVIIIFSAVVIIIIMIIKDTSRPSSWPGKSLSSDPVVAAGEMPVVVNVGGIR